MHCEYFDKIQGTNLDEQYVAFALVDAEHLISNLLKENIINQNEYDSFYALFMKVEERCGFKKGETDSMTIDEEKFIDLIIAEYEEWCGYHGESYITNNKEDDEELFDFVMCHIDIDGFKIEELNDDAFCAWKKFFDSIDKSKIWDCIDEINHPYDPWTEHRADWYGLR